VVGVRRRGRSHPPSAPRPGGDLARLPRDTDSQSPPRWGVPYVVGLPGGVRQANGRLDSIFPRYLRPGSASWDRLTCRVRRSDRPHTHKEGAECGLYDFAMNQVHEPPPPKWLSSEESSCVHTVHSEFILVVNQLVNYENALGIQAAGSYS
jgi:hypothetical protein